MPSFLFDVRIPRFLIQIVLFKQEMHAELSDELGLIQISIKLSENFILILQTAFVDGQVQTNLSMQTIETSIWVIRSTSKGHEGLGNFTIETRP